MDWKGKMVRKIDAIPTIKTGLWTSDRENKADPVEIATNKVQALPLYSSPALRDHDYADFISNIPEKFEFSEIADDAVPESVEEAEIIESFDHMSYNITVSEEHSKDRLESKKVNSFKYYR